MKSNIYTPQQRPLIDCAERIFQVWQPKGQINEKRWGERREKLAPLNKYAQISFYSPLHFCRCAKRKEAEREREREPHPAPSVVTFARKKCGNVQLNLLFLILSFSSGRIVLGKGPGFSERPRRR